MPLPGYGRKCPYIYKPMLVFQSRTALQSPAVKVYVEGDNYKHYYVDIDEILPKVIRH